MATGRQFIQGALEALQVYEPGETVLPADLARGFVVLNQMMDSWSNESMTCFALLEQSAPLVPGKRAYTIGPGGDFDTIRPINILSGPGTAYLKDTNNNRYGVSVVEQDVWNRIWNLDTPLSNLPDTLFYDSRMPYGIINIYPVPTLPYTLFWDSNLQLGSFPSVSTQLQLPPGYEMAIEKNLALLLKPFFPSAILGPELIAQARESKGNVKRSNNRENIMILDRALGGKGAAFNPYSDSVARR